VVWCCDACSRSPRKPLEQAYDLNFACKDAENRRATPSCPGAYVRRKLQRQVQKKTQARPIAGDVGKL
jgi:hypothetical protein